MERQSYDINRVFKIRRVSYRIAKKLEESHKINRSSIESYKETIQEEKKEPSRIKGWRKHMIGSQKHSFEQTLKEVRLEKIQTF